MSKSRFLKMVDAPKGSKFVLQGNEAFALGVVHAGYHAADGYPGTPSTEVIDKSLKYVQDRMKVGWSVNEATATAVAIGHSVAGYDSVVTMKIPGVFQAGDTITTSAFYNAEAGAFVIYAAADYVPSSTQHVIDARYFFASARVVVFEPRNHQEMYDIAWIAADISRKFKTQVVVLASGILAHSEGLVTTNSQRKITPRELPKNLYDWMLLPTIARKNYNEATTLRIPGVLKLAENNDFLVKEEKGSDNFGIVVVGESDMILRETLANTGLNPSILSMSIANPVPINRIKSFANKIEGPIIVVEDGDRFLEEKMLINGIKCVGKGENSTITDWNPETLANFLSKTVSIPKKIEKTSVLTEVTPPSRPPSICPGCPYRAFSLVVQELRKQKKIYAGFGEIGCSTLIHFFDAIDTVLCMGGSDSMRQGFVLSRPEMKSKTISVIGDSCEAHSGIDATRNAVFKNVPGIKVTLDNRITAMTGGQPAPSSDTNLAGVPNKFNLKKAIEAEECDKVVSVDAYNKKEIKKVLLEAIDDAEKDKFTNIIVEGPCIHIVPKEKKISRVTVNEDKCKKCGLCLVCSGITANEKGFAQITSLCTNCISETPVCMQQCPFDAIEFIDENEQKTKKSSKPPKPIEIEQLETVNKEDLPESLRIAIRGIGGQGNLFFGKVLTTVASKTPYKDTHIVKGDTHGMAQLGGSVISTFSCGKVHSPIFYPQTADVLVAMEASEILRPGFLEMLKPNGTIIFNKFMSLPPNTKREEYPKFDKILDALKGYKVIEVDALKIVQNLGDKEGKTANVAVLGVLSTIEPFNKIPQSIWLKSLLEVSPNEFIAGANHASFMEGRKIANER